MGIDLLEGQVCGDENSDPQRLVCSEYFGEVEYRWAGDADLQKRNRELAESR